MRGTIDYAGQDIAYEARHSTRKTLAISVRPDGAVEIVAPEGTKQKVIELRLRRRASWVLEQRRYFEQFRPRTPERQFVGGETHLYLGRQYRLKITQACEDSVRLKGGYFWITTSSEPCSKLVAGLLHNWYRRHAEIKLAERFDLISPRFSRILPAHPKLSVRMMKRRWGSYSPRGKISLNIDLVRAPQPCIDYVIVHELTHGRHPNHGRAFFDLLSQMMPDWEKRKTALERMLA